jgi:hypothetical protein
MQQIRKTYTGVNPELLLAEIRDFAVARGLRLIDTKLETFTLPDESASFITRGTLVFSPGKDSEQESLRVHIVGSVREDVKLMMDVDETKFNANDIKALMDDIDFIFSERESGRG